MLGLLWIHSSSHLLLCISGWDKLTVFRRVSQPIRGDGSRTMRLEVTIADLLRSSPAITLVCFGLFRPDYAA